ncbi:MarR family winged helix-turn-helix transcriptional regulator [Kitasatospora sp. NBC_00240]|uniref:MarR family winged helix-turn-helix transcriptional regulator n=1 Tax=Kitasatospora sp. NBC_00240 TaxID=2903567 RepID=UPI00224FFE48|nr:MarR family winged helix-turn-helix transcriptional regulator [Kitasatospora sp. NBC_00240]MCX5214987.1 MarR family winged helix-turn-helix transcriptional regulator [Kitasatospora sp. NBC_00240]
MDKVSPLPGRPDDAAVASSVVELLEVLWGGGRDLVAAPVSVSQLRVLYVLEAHDGINLRTLTETLDSRPSSASRLCDRLEAIGLVQRTASAASRRELELRLTPAGRTFLAGLRAGRQQSLEGILQHMPEADRRALLSGLRSFRAAALGTAAEMAPGAGTGTEPAGAGPTAVAEGVRGIGSARSA